MTGLNLCQLSVVYTVAHLGHFTRVGCHERTLGGTITRPRQAAACHMRHSAKAAPGMAGPVFAIAALVTAIPFRAPVRHTAAR